MSILLSIVAIIAGLILILLFVAWLLPKQYSVAVSVVINKPLPIVYEYISLFRYQTQYSEWLKADPDLKPDIQGIDGTVGAILKWESHNPDKNKNVGTGEQEIIDMDKDKIEVELRLFKPMPATCKIINGFVGKGPDTTEYTCTFYAYAKFPANLPSYVFGRKFIQKAQQKTLNNIKTILGQS